MKRIFGELFLILFLATPASAHILKSDGDIGVLLHLDPDDDPIVGQPANFFFEIKDRTDKFSPANCTCKIQILNQGNQVFDSDLFVDSSSNSINSAVFSYTFAQRAVYNVIVSGIPKNNASFQAFTVKYDLRISRESGGNSTDNSSTIWVIGGFIILAIIAGAIIYFRKS